MMGTAAPLRTAFSTGELRQLAKRAEDVDQARWLLSLAAVLDGQSRKAAAEIGAMDRQTLRDWVHPFNEKGPAGLVNGKAPGPVSKLSAEQKQELKRIVEAGPDPARDGVVRWRCVDLRRVIKERFEVDLDEVSIGRVLKELGFAHVSPRPRHPTQDPQAIEAFAFGPPLVVLSRQKNWSLQQEYKLFPRGYMHTSGQGRVAKEIHFSISTTPRRCNGIGMGSGRKPWPKRRAPRCSIGSVRRSSSRIPSPEPLDFSSRISGPRVS
jgi:transposase